MHRDLETILLTQEQLKKRIMEMGKQLTKDYQGETLLAVGILKGAIVFFSDLIRELELDVETDFMAVSSYGSSSKSSGAARLLKDLDYDIKDKNVLIVEDIIDTGLTLNYLVNSLEARNPKTLKTCCLLDKPSRRKIEFSPDYIGFQVPDEFLVGYGLDYASKYRNLPYIGVLKQNIYEK